LDTGDFYFKESSLCLLLREDGNAMTKIKKLKNETQIISEVIRIGSSYVKKRGAGAIDESDSQKDKLEFIYRLLEHDKQIQPIPLDQLTDLAIRHRLAMWLTGKLPKDHPLLK